MQATPAEAKDTITKEAGDSNGLIDPWAGPGQLMKWMDGWMMMMTGWWFHFFYFHPYLGKIPSLTNIFQRGWNHQLDDDDDDDDDDEKDDACLSDLLQRSI